MIDLYCWPTPNGWKIAIALEEMNLPYSTHLVNIGKGDQFKPDFLSISPNNRMPAIVNHDGPDGAPLTLFESGAILLHLAEQYSEDIQTIEHKALTSQWLQFANSTLSIALFVPRHREKEFPRLMKELDRQLETGQPLVGNIWGAADCAIQAYLAYLPLMFPQIDLTPYPSIRTTIKHVERRPAYRKAMGNLR